jgi:hypothetical protein
LKRVAEKVEKGKNLKTTVMPTVRAAMFLAVLTALTVSCGSTSNSKIIEWSAVATVGGTDATTQKLVRSVLRKHNIPCFMEGSMGYAVMVPKDRLTEARDALLESRELKGETSFWMLPLPKS